MKELEELLRQNRPEMPDEGHFILETNARLEAVEGIKRIVDEEYRRRRIALWATLAGGIVAGGAAAVLLMRCPFQPLQLEKHLLEKALEWPLNGREYIVFLLAACATALGILLMNRKEETF